MDVKLAILIKSLNIMDVTFSGFTVVSHIIIYIIQVSKLSLQLEDVDHTAVLIDDHRILTF